MIKENNIGATALFLNDKIDQGNIIKVKDFQIPNNINIDDIFDPYIRDMLLIEVLKEYIDKKQFNSFSQNIEAGEKYYVIYLILKYLISLDNNAKKVCGVYWFIVLSRSGKSTLVNTVYYYLKKKNRRVKFNEIYVKCSIEECARRDRKGYYKRALASKLGNFVGFDIDFEKPMCSEIVY